MRETLAQLRKSGLAVDVIATTSSGHASELAAEAYAQGYRRFIAVGGDGTAHEILNGLFGRAKPQDRISLGFLPLGTGNSFLRDFAEDGADAAFRALLAGRTRPVDLIRLTHSDGEIYSLNILSLGFTADVGSLTNRYFKPLGPLGYLLGVFVRVAQLRRRAFTLRCENGAGHTAWQSLSARCSSGRCGARSLCVLCALCGDYVGDRRAESFALRGRICL